MKRTGPIDFHLGQSFSRNDDGEMEISAKRYVDKMIDTYVQLYGEKPRKASSPLEQNDHPEMDDSPFLGQDETQQFQSLIGAMQWAVSIERLDIVTAVMSLSRGNNRIFIDIGFYTIVLPYTSSLPTLRKCRRKGILDLSWVNVLF